MKNGHMSEKSQNNTGFKEVLANIDEAKRLGSTNESVGIVGVVSGSDVDRENWQNRLEEIGPCIFNSDGSTMVLSLQEKIGDKTREGNFLGTLLAYRYVKAAAKNNIAYKDIVTMIGMLFGRGERMSPITQAKGCRKPGIEVTPKSVEVKCCEIAFSAIEEALLYFVPVAKYLEKRGFRGILNKWGDETQVPSIDLTGEVKDDRSLAEYDVIKVISVLEITDELAKQKDWVVFDDKENMWGQLSRNNKEVLIENLKKRGIKPRKDGKFYAGVSLGPVAVSYDVLDIALEVFGKDVETDGVYFDFDPYFLMALAMKDDKDKWDARVVLNTGLKQLVEMIPDFFEKVQKIKKVFKEKKGRELSLKIFDLGKDVFWSDIGQHSAMRKKFLALNAFGEKGTIARKIANIPETRDKDGNIIVNSKISRKIIIKNSVVVNSEITGAGSIEESIILDSELKDVEINKAFAIRSIRVGMTVLKEHSGIYESLGAGDLVLEKGMRHVSVLTGSGRVDMEVSEDTNLRDKENTYNVPIFDNAISFMDAYDEMFGVSMEELKKRRVEVVDQLNRIKDRNVESKPLKFGTSGLRDKVEFMTDLECYINADGFIRFLKERGEVDEKHNVIGLAGDLRSSTPRVISAVAKAIEDNGCVVNFCGRVPSPTLAYYGMQYLYDDGHKGTPSIMVTGSHIPDDRNGIKFSKRSGEVLKSDEKDILKNVAKAREEEYSRTKDETLFDETGMFKAVRTMPEAAFEKKAVNAYTERYKEAFPGEPLKGRKVVLYQHSAVGRDVFKEVFETLGAEVITAERSDEFVPVDTEKVSEKTRTLLERLARENSPFAVISTDGDSDRPLLADENGQFLMGDKLGALVAVFLEPDFAAIPISANDAVVSALGDKGIKLKQTQIGSPYVIKAMNDELENNPDQKVVSWESNGGFLLGSDWQINGNSLTALPTRDAVLPLVSAMLLAIKRDKSVAELISSELPARYTHADVVDDNTPGCEKYTADMGKAIIKMLSPEESSITQVNFTAEGVKIEGSEETDEITSELNGIKKKLGNYFTKDLGFDEIVSINFVDGIRIVFSNNDVAHLRPSGNAPEFRMYATSDTQERADEIVEKRLKIVPAIVKEMV